MQQLLAPITLSESGRSLELPAEISMSNPSVFASRSSSPLNSQITGMTLDDESEANRNEEVAIQGLLSLKSVTPKMEDTISNGLCSNESNRNAKGEDPEDRKSGGPEDEEQKTSPQRNGNAVGNVAGNQMVGIDWENESDSSEDDERYFTRRDHDLKRQRERRLKVSTKMSDDFKLPEGYLAHSLFVCPVQTDYVADPQTKLVCGHLISHTAFMRLQSIQRQRQHQENRNRTLKINCPICDEHSDVEKDVRYIYLGRFPNLRHDARFADILDRKDLGHNVSRWMPGATQINGAHE